MAGEIIAFTAKPRGAQIARGLGLGTVECAKTVLAVHAPVGYVLDEGNEVLEAKPALLNRDALVGRDEQLIPEYAGTAGASAFVQRTLDPGWATQVY